MVTKWLPGASFRCLTDTPIKGIPCIPLIHPYEGWFAKIELFRPGIFPAGSRCLYLDIDSVVVGDLSAIASYAGPFAALSDFYKPQMAASGVMVWQADNPPPLYDPANPPRFRGRLDYYIDAKVKADRLQDLFPGQIVSWKSHCQGGAIPKGARIICHHGFPRPWQVPQFYEKALA
jgi:hypothetical protein